MTNRAVYRITLNTRLMGDEAERNPNLMELINICRDNGLSWSDSLPISTTAPFTYTTDTPWPTSWRAAAWPSPGWAACSTPCPWAKR